MPSTMPRLADAQPALLEALIQASYDGFCILAPDGTFLAMNAAFERITGLVAHDWIGRTLADMRNTPGTARESAALQVLNGTYPASTLVNIRGGEMMLVTANPHFDQQGALRHIILNVRNISQLNYVKYQLEQGRSRAKLAEIEEFSRRVLTERLERVGLGGFVFRSPLTAKIVSTALQIADYDFTVLLDGETGVGKGMLAKLLHQASRRAPHPFVEVNCAALPEPLVEAELFGHEAGAFTGAAREGRAGFIEAARGGTLFLDEIGELPKVSQGKLLKFLDDKRLVRVGGTRSQTIDVRVIAATNRDLHALVRTGAFRADLLYRLEVIPLYLPPLRERPEDLKALVYCFLEELNRTAGREHVVASEAVQYLLGQELPGNVRQLRNLLTRLVLTCPDSEITAQHVRDELERPGAGRAEERRPIRTTLEEVERRILRECATRCSSTYEIADHLGINQSSVVRKLKKYGIAGPLPGAERPRSAR